MNFVRGINGDIISKITVKKGYRLGTHPYYYRLHNKWLMKRYLFFMVKSRRAWLGWWLEPLVCIHGSDGSTIKRIKCRSNDRAYKLRDELMREWTNER